MGVYIFKSIHSNWIKIGHHKITEKRPNVYFRVIRRGFNSCKHPTEIDGLLDFEDLKLLNWFPNLIRKDENRIHKLCRKRFDRVGEWYPSENYKEILNIIIEYGGIEKDFPNYTDKRLAFTWAKKEYIFKKI